AILQCNGKVEVEKNTFAANTAHSTIHVSSSLTKINFNEIVNPSATFEYYCDVKYPIQMDEKNNYWGMDNEDEIAKRIYDFVKDSSKGVVLFIPHCKEPCSNVQ